MGYLGSVSNITMPRVQLECPNRGEAQGGGWVLKCSPKAGTSEGSTGTPVSMDCIQGAHIRLVFCRSFMWAPMVVAPLWPSLWHPYGPPCGTPMGVIRKVLPVRVPPLYGVWGVGV